jgi:hypothetical protein
MLIAKVKTPLATTPRGGLDGTVYIPIVAAVPTYLVVELTGANFSKKNLGSIRLMLEEQVSGRLQNVQTRELAQRKKRGFRPKGKRAKSWLEQKW